MRTFNREKKFKNYDSELSYKSETDNAHRSRRELDSFSLVDSYPFLFMVISQAVISKLSHWIIKWIQFYVF